MRHSNVIAVVASLLVVSACSGSDDTGRATSNSAGTDDRTQLSAETDDVRVEVADCFVVDTADGRRYQTTVEVHNDADEAHAVAVTIIAELGRGGTSDTIDVPAGASDAWAVTADETTEDPAGDARCGDYVMAVELALDTGS